MFALLIATTALLAAAPNASGGYRVEPARTLLIARTYRGGFAKSRGHDHAVRAGQVQGRVEYVPGHPEQDRLDFSVPTAGLVVDDARARQAAHLGPGPSDSQRKSIDHSMRSPDQLDTGRFPTIEFRSTHVEERGPGQLTVIGAFTLHGVTRSVSLQVQVREDGGEVVGTGSFDIKPSDYGIKPFSAFLGAVKNQDRVTFLLQVSLVR